MGRNSIGKLIGSNGGLYTVLTDGDNEIIECRARGILRHEHITPLVGDSVTLADDGKGAVIESVNERRNALIRPPLANLDILFLVMASKKPSPSLFTADKLLSICEYNGIEPVIIIGKCELDGDSVKEIKSVYEKADYRVFAVSCYENIGIDELNEYIKTAIHGKTAAFAGLSGVGKSTLLNRLFPELELSTGEVSRKTERGRHTTRKVELFSANGGFIADTPGFSMLDFERFDFFEKDDLPETFKEFRDCIGHCRYKKCTHTKEEGCAVLEKLKNGDIAPSRHESFLALYDTLKQKHSWDK